MKQMKKEFQKVIATIRKEYGESINRTNCSYPKPMMTEAQMEKRTATVNCGGEWKKLEATKEIAEMVLNDERFKSFLEKYSAQATKELNPFGTIQIRINY